jgi:predicted choloylglycine hydrolase
MYHPRIKGSYYDMGRNYGALLYRHGFRVTAQPKEKLDFSARSEPEVKRVFPGILDEIRGFGEGCHASYNDMAAFMLTIGAFKPQAMCSGFAAFNGSDVIFGRNYDFFYSFKKYTESYLTVPQDAFISLGHSDVFIGREDGINENGLAIAMTGLSDKTVKPGVSFVLAVRSVLDKCANVKEASKNIMDMHASACANFLLADDSGDMAVTEVSPDKVMIRKPEHGEDFIVCTNHFVLSEMQQYEDLERRKIENWDTIPRYKAISEGIRKAGRKMNVEAAQRIMSDHTGYVCSHQNKIKLGTLWSITASLKDLDVFRAEGNPCRTKYKEDQRLRKAAQKSSSEKEEQKLKPNQKRGLTSPRSRRLS